MRRHQEEAGEDDRDGAGEELVSMNRDPKLMRLVEWQARLFDEGAPVEKKLDVLKRINKRKAELSAGNDI